MYYEPDRRLGQLKRYASMSVSEYEFEIQRVAKALGHAEGTCFATDTVQRHYAILESDEVIPFDHDLNEILPCIMNALSTGSDATDQYERALHLSSDPDLADVVPVPVIEFMISIEHYYQYRREYSPSSLESISYRILSYIDSKHEINDDSWFQHPAIRREFLTQMETVSRCKVDPNNDA